MNGILWVVPVWGREYVERWLRYGYPSMMAPGIRPALTAALSVSVERMASSESATVLGVHRRDNPFARTPDD